MIVNIFYTNIQMIQNPILQYTPYIPGQVVDIEYNMIKRFDEEIIELQKQLKINNTKQEIVAKMVIVGYIFIVGLYIVLFVKALA